MCGVSTDFRGPTSANNSTAYRIITSPYSSNLQPGSPTRTQTAGTSPLFAFSRDTTSGILTTGSPLCRSPRTPGRTRTPSCEPRRVPDPCYLANIVFVLQVRTSATTNTSSARVMPNVLMNAIRGPSQDDGTRLARLAREYVDLQHLPHRSLTNIARGSHRHFR